MCVTVFEWAPNVLSKRVAGCHVSPAPCIQKGLEERPEQVMGMVAESSLC